MRWIPVLFSALLSFAVLAAPAGASHHTESKLDALFAELNRVESAAEAEPIEKEIWELWMESGDVELDSLMLFGISAMEIGNLPAALSTFDRLVAVAPDYAEAWNKRATVHYLMGNLEASIADVAHTLSLEPRHFGALSGLGLIYVAIGNDKAALKAFEKALAANPHLHEIENLIARARQRLNGRGRPGRRVGTYPARAGMVSPQSGRAYPSSRDTHRSP